MTNTEPAFSGYELPPHEWDALSSILKMKVKLHCITRSVENTDDMVDVIIRHLMTKYTIMPKEQKND